MARRGLISPATPWRVQTIDRVRVVLDVTVLVTGLLVIFGWVLNISTLTQLRPNLASMPLNTAICLVCISGAALTRVRSLAIGLKFFALTITVLSLFEGVTEIDLGVDQLIFSDHSLGRAHPGRPALSTALGLALLLGSPALWRQGYRRVAQIGHSATIVLGGIAVLGYSYGAKSLYHVGIFSTMALHTAICISLLGFSGLLTIPESYLHWILRGESAGPVLLRRVVPFVVFGFPVIGFLRLRAEQHGFFEDRFGVAIMAIVTGSLVLVLLWRAATSLDRADRDRLRALDELGALNEQLERRVQERSAQLAAIQSRAATFEEQDRIAATLHDNVVQRLFSVGMSLQSIVAKVNPADAPKVNAAVDEVDIAIRELRLAVFGDPRASAAIETEEPRPPT